MPIKRGGAVAIVGEAISFIQLFTEYISLRYRVLITIAAIVLGSIYFSWDGIAHGMKVIRKKLCVWFARKLDTKDLRDIYVERISRSNNPQQ